ncbi:MAG: hypothetical protein JO019_01540 [Candidatus Kaiserbacteria bacterium]|nr:hypothetical protein [Candidatus Kaiserbacteria bacterium]
MRQTEEVEFVMDPEMPVVLRGQTVPLKEVPLGLEFAYLGRLWQSSVITALFSAVPDGGRIKRRDQWFARERNNVVRELAPNGPFGAVTKQARTISHQDSVQMLVVTDRGPATD